MEAERGTPASCRIATASAATSGVCSAGLAATVLPAISAAATGRGKIARGKFQGEIATKTPRRAAQHVGSRPWAGQRLGRPEQAAASAA
jgi:hypothetical protein